MSLRKRKNLTIGQRLLAAVTGMLLLAGETAAAGQEMSAQAETLNAVIHRLHTMVGRPAGSRPHGLAD